MKHMFDLNLKISEIFRNKTESLINQNDLSLINSITQRKTWKMNQSLSKIG